MEGSVPRMEESLSPYWGAMIEGFGGERPCNGLTLDPQEAARFNDLVARLGVSVIRSLLEGYGVDSDTGICGQVRLEPGRRGVPRLDELFTAFKALLDSARSEVARVARRGVVKGDEKLKLMECMLENSIAGRGEWRSIEVEWRSIVQLESNGRNSVSKAKLHLNYTIKGAGLIGEIVVFFGYPDNEAECLARGCSGRRLPRVVRGLHGIVTVTSSGRIACMPLCIPSCKRFDYARLPALATLHGFSEDELGSAAAP